MCLSELPMTKNADSGNHGRIVGAERNRREQDVDATLCPLRNELRPQVSVRGNSADDHQTMAMEATRRLE